MLRARNLRKSLVMVLMAAFTIGQLPLPLVTAAAQTMVTLREGREIEAEMIDDASGGRVEAEGQVHFRVVGDVQVHEQVAIAAGTEGVLVVAEAKGNGMFGKAGEVVFTDGWIPVGTDQIPVAIKGRQTFKGKSRTFTSIVLTLVLVGPFIKGGAGGLKAGERIFLEVKETQQVPAEG
jgi:hypothetical protein